MHLIKNLEDYFEGYEDALVLFKEKFLDTLEVINPYEQCVQYDSIESGIQAHAETYSFNIESELFHQLTKEQQTLWRKEIEYAVISGGQTGIELARDIRYKENVEVKTDKDNSLEKFKSLQHITNDPHQTLEDWGYAPNLYFFDGMWHVDWISCEEGDSIKCFTEDTAEEAINKAYNWFHSTFCNGYTFNRQRCFSDRDREKNQ